MYAVKQFSHYILGNQCTVYTDHEALQQLMTIKEPKGRKARWQIALQVYNLESKYKPGKHNIKANFLCRMNSHLKANALTTDSEPPCPNMRDAQLQDPEIGTVLTFLTTGKVPEGSMEAEAKALAAKAEHFVLANRCLLLARPHPRRPGAQLHRVMVPASLRRRVIEECLHSPLAGHLGQLKTEDRIWLRFWWPYIDKDVQKALKECPSCQVCKAIIPRMNPLLKSIRTQRMFQLVEMDFQELSLSEEGYKYILLFQCHFTKYIIALPTTNQRAETVAKLFVNEVVCKWGAPEALLSDRAATFLSAIVSEVCRLCKTRKISTSGYAPKPQGLVERSNQTFQEILRHFVNRSQINWPEFLPIAAFAANTSIHWTTVESAHYLLFRCDLQLPVQEAFQYSIGPYVLDEDLDYPTQLQHRLTVAWQAALDHTGKEQEHQAKAHARKGQPTPEYQVNQKVLVELHIYPGRAAKLGQRFKGPYVISHVYDNNTVGIVYWEIPDCPPIRINIQKLRPYVEDTGDLVSTQPNRTMASGWQVAIGSGRCIESDPALRFSRRPGLQSQPVSSAFPTCFSALSLLRRSHLFSLVPAFMLLSLSAICSRTGTLLPHSLTDFGSAFTCSHRRGGRRRHSRLVRHRLGQWLGRRPVNSILRRRWQRPFEETLPELDNRQQGYGIVHHHRKLLCLHRIPHFASNDAAIGVDLIQRHRHAPSSHLQFCSLHSLLPGLQQLPPHFGHVHFGPRCDHVLPQFKPGHSQLEVPVEHGIHVLVGVEHQCRQLQQWRIELSWLPRLPNSSRHGIVTSHQPPVQVGGGAQLMAMHQHVVLHLRHSLQVVRRVPEGGLLLKPSGILDQLIQVPFGG